MVDPRLKSVKAVSRATLKQYAFYFAVFLFGFVYQPDWVRDNFWLKADFYGSLPFQFPFFLFLISYASISAFFAFIVIKSVKKHL
jgi:hypothetical protein